MLTREAILELCRNNPEAIVELILSLTERVNKLEEQINKDSRNSHKPPSSDGLKKRPPKPKRIRDDKKRSAGGQKGHQGSSLTLSENPTETVRYESENCRACGESLRETSGAVFQRRQVIDIPEPQVMVTEHQAMSKRCPCCGVVNTGELPEELKGRVQYGAKLRALVNYLMVYQLLPYQRTKELLGTIYKLSISTGTLHRMLQDGYELLAEATSQIQTAVKEAEVIHVDETGHRVGAKTRWLHVASTKQLTFYYSHKARGQKGHQAGAVLPQFKGTVVHDFYRSYLGYECQHALCNAHLLRDLQAVVDRDDSQSWAQRLSQLLVMSHRLVQHVQEQGETTLPQPVLMRIEALYDHIVARAHALNPKPPPSGKPGRTKQTKTRNLLDRLLTYKPDIWRFIFDFKVPFDNNLAERDLRMVKVQQKISNCFRSELGAEMFCRIRGYISTLLKQEYDLFPVLTRVFQGDVLIPLPTE